MNPLLAAGLLAQGSPSYTKGIMLCRLGDYSGGVFVIE